ncbi:SDR family oxidoreductase [Rhodohalobacter sp. SW132]|uniref:SDR family NAD(P)-dependent oxidoreductase n=1 Tax=Rhodohalobacter sp. SW132 TaxID=2293433 RepID=UPI000E247ABB|nr:SDR family oxidoreductase [Rhodohalobacter sp. SW132]REL33609.1 SDR family oxidoreductase [Rhodohalobacter sp. SW132]
MEYLKSSVLITGASRGIGRSVAITFAASTNRPILLLARNEQMLNETRDLCIKAGASKVEILVCDATDPDQISQLSIDPDIPLPGIIINNAGSYLYKKTTETSPGEFKEQIDVNLFTAVHIVNRFLKDLLKLDRALIINICSVGALRGLAESGAYASAKHALLGYTRSLREELKDTEIGVTAINLGQTHSTSWKESDMSPDKLINPSDVASLIVTMSQLTKRTLVEEIIIQPQHGRVAPM